MSPPSAAEPPDDAEVARRIQALHIRAGSPPDLRQRDAALAWLLQHGERTLPVALALAARAPPDAVLIDLLGRLRRPETTPVLLRAWAEPRLRPYAAAGLGQSPDPGARSLLHQALAAPDASEVAAALAGLGASGDPALCATFRAHLQDERGEVRWMAVEAGCRLRCVDPGVLEALARQDPDASVRALAQRWLSRHTDPEPPPRGPG